VSKGDRFGSPTKRVSGVPTGNWRDGLFNCFEYGVCHPALCLAWWPYTIACAFGQLLRRLNLNICGCPATPTSWNPFRFWWMWVALSLTFLSLGGFCEGLYIGKGDIPPPFVLTISGIGYLLWYSMFATMFVLLIRLRNYVRQKYKIQDGKDICGGHCCGDCLVTWCCTTCVLAHMMRHTANYKAHKASCCSETGLPEYVEVVY